MKQIWFEAVNWIRLAQNGEQQYSFVDMAMNDRFA